MNKIFLALILLLNVVTNVFSMDPTGNKGSWIFEGLTKEEQPQFNQDFSDGSMAAQLIDEYNCLKAKKLSMGRDFSQQDDEALKYTEDMIDCVGLGYFVDRQPVELVKKLHHQEKRHGFNRDNGRNARRLSFSSSSSGSENEGNQQLIFINYTPQDVAFMSMSSNSSSSFSE